MAQAICQRRGLTPVLAPLFLASYADVLTGSSRNHGAGTRDEPLRMSAWEATLFQAYDRFLTNQCAHELCSFSRASSHVILCYQGIPVDDDETTVIFTGFL